MLAGTLPRPHLPDRAPIQSMCSPMAARVRFAGAVETTVFDTDITHLAD